MDEQRQNDQLESIYNSSVPIQDTALKTSREWWTTQSSGERGSGISMLAERHGDVDNSLCVSSKLGFLSFKCILIDLVLFFPRCLSFLLPLLLHLLHQFLLMWGWFALQIYCFLYFWCLLIAISNLFYSLLFL